MLRDFDFIACFQCFCRLLHITDKLIWLGKSSHFQTNWQKFRQPASEEKGLVCIFSKHFIYAPPNLHMLGFVTYCQVLTCLVIMSSVIMSFIMYSQYVNVRDCSISMKSRNMKWWRSMGQMWVVGIFSMVWCQKVYLCIIGLHKLYTPRSLRDTMRHEQHGHIWCDAICGAAWRRSYHRAVLRSRD